MANPTLKRDRPEAACPLYLISTLGGNEFQFLGGHRMNKKQRLSAGSCPVILMIPQESILIILGALLLAGLTITLLAWLGSFLLPYLKSVAQANVKIPGFNVVLKGSGLMILFLALFVLIVVLYAVLRMVPATP